MLFYHNVNFIVSRLHLSTDTCYIGCTVVVFMSSACFYVYFLQCYNFVFAHSSV